MVGRVCLGNLPLPLPLPPAHVWSQQSYLSILGCPGGLGCDEKVQRMGKELAE